MVKMPDSRMADTPLSHITKRSHVIGWVKMSAIAVDQHHIVWLDLSAEMRLRSAGHDFPVLVDLRDDGTMVARIDLMNVNDRFTTRHTLGTGWMAVSEVFENGELYRELSGKLNR